MCTVQYGPTHAVITEDVGFMVHALIFQSRKMKKLTSVPQGRSSLPHNRFRKKQQTGTGETRTALHARAAVQGRTRS